jgi:phospholipid N-methyltransferase
LPDSHTFFNSKNSSSLDGLRFFGEFLRSPLRTAALAPSSAALAQAVTHPVPERGEPVVVELGPGTGSFTREIQRKLRGRGYHLAVELNPIWAELVQRRFPDVDVVCADAATLPTLLLERGISSVDVVISGLPWSAFPIDVGGTLTDEVAKALSDDGAFTQFAYSVTRWTGPARTLLRGLRSNFEEVLITGPVWRNLPPAAVYVSRRPRRHEVLSVPTLGTARIGA